MTGTLAPTAYLLLLVPAFLAACVWLWRRRLPQALLCFGIAVVLLGALLDTAALQEFAFGVLLSWGALPQWFYNAPFLAGIVLVLTGGLLSLIEDVIPAFRLRLQWRREQQARERAGIHEPSLTERQQMGFTDVEYRQPLGNTPAQGQFQPYDPNAQRGGFYGGADD